MPVTRTLTPWILIALLAVAALGNAACGGGQSNADEISPAGDGAESGGEAAGDTADDAAGDSEEQAVPVEVVELERGPIEAVLRFSTNLEAEEAVGVFAQAARRVQALYVEEGDRVRKGQVLLRLQDDEQRTRLAKVEAQLERARREYDRQQRLFSNELISEQTFNDATYELNQLELEFEDAQRELGYTEVQAPISGTITERRVSVGDHITVNQHLFDLVDFDSIVARVYVPEKELRRLEPGQPARIYAPALGEERAYRGSIDRLSPVVDPRSGTVKVTVGIPRQEGLRPGMYVDVELVTDVHENAVLVPKRALVYDDDQVFVYRMDPEERRVERVYLTPLLEDERHVEPAEKLDAGDVVVMAGQAGLKDGARVRLAGEAAAAAGASGDELPGEADEVADSTGDEGATAGEEAE